MNYSWKILEISKKDVTNQDGVVLSNSVIQISWSKTGTTDDDVEASYVGKTHLSAEQVAEADFVAYESLTEDIVLQWISSSLSDADVAIINKCIQDKINKQSVTKTEVFPWS